MKPYKRQRLIFVLLTVLCISGAAYLAFTAFQEHVSFFYTPSDPLPLQTRCRLGGIVKEGSIHQDGSFVHFKVTDFQKEIPVAYEGVLPDLFREGQGVVTEGMLLPSQTFKAEKVLAKHDETYMPPEVADALKKKGLWRPTSPTQDRP